MVHFPGLAHPRLCIQRGVVRFYRTGLPHSEIPGSKLVCSSPRLIAACHVLLRLLAPRHPPYALSSLTIKFTQSTPWVNYGASVRAHVRAPGTCCFVPDSVVKEPPIVFDRGPEARSSGADLLFSRLPQPETKNPASSRVVPPRTATGRSPNSTAFQEVSVVRISGSFLQPIIIAKSWSNASIFLIGLRLGSPPGNRQRELGSAFSTILFLVVGKITSWQVGAWHGIR